MRAWTVDADDIRVAEDFDESLLHRTPEIDSFLRPDRDDELLRSGCDDGRFHSILSYALASSPVKDLRSG